jgi:hypothetical protein
MMNSVRQWTHQARARAFYVLVGLSAGSGSMALSQTCGGACPSGGNCGSCLTNGLPLPLLGFMAVTAAGAVWARLRGASD